MATADLEVVRFPSSERRPLPTFVTGRVGGAVLGGAVGLVSWETDGPSILAGSRAESVTL